MTHLDIQDARWDEGGAHRELLGRRCRMMKLRLSICWMVLLMLLISCADDRSSISETMESVQMDEERVSPVEILIFVDNSGSMQKSDPENLRMWAVKCMVERVTRDEALMETTRIGVVSFSDDAQIIVPLDEPSAAKDALSGIQFRALGNTGLLSAMRVGYQTFVAADSFSERKPVMLFVTDGSPYDSRKFKETGAYFLELQAFIEEKLRPYGCSIHVMGMDVRGGWDEAESHWRAIADGVYKVEGMKDLRVTLGNIVERIYGIPPVSREVVTPGNWLRFNVPPYTEKLEVYILKGADDGRLTLYNPDGGIVEEDERDTLTKDCGSYMRLSVLEPSHGYWLLKATGREFVIYRTLQPYSMKLVWPEGTYPLGKPLRVEAAFMRGDGKPAMELADYRLRLSGRITTPVGGIHKLEFVAVGDGKHAAQAALVPHLEGIYRVALTAQGGDLFRSETLETFTVVETPYVVIAKPVSSIQGLGDLEVGIYLFQAGERFPAQEVRDSSILARLESPSGQISTQWLELKPDSQIAALRCIIPNGLREEGRYRLTVKSMYSVVSAETLNFHVRRGLLSQVWRYALYTGGGIASMLALAALVFLFRARRFPRITGIVSAHLSSDEEVLLGQKRFYRKRWGFFRLSKPGATPGRWLLIAGAPGGGEVISVWYRTGLMFARRRMYRNGILKLEKHTLRYL